MLPNALVPIPTCPRVPFCKTRSYMTLILSWRMLLLPRRYLIMIGPLASDHPLLHCLYNTPIVVVVISKACNSTLRGCKQLVTTTTAANCSERAAVASLSRKVYPPFRTRRRPHDVIKISLCLNLSYCILSSPLTRRREDSTLPIHAPRRPLCIPSIFSQSFPQCLFD